MIEITLDKVWGFQWSASKARLSYGSTPDSINESLGPKDLKLVRNLAVLGPSHAKFLRTVTVWLTIKASRYWWIQFDTYKVGTTALSESTMHTIMNGALKPQDFAGEINSPHLQHLNRLIKEGRFLEVKVNLPEGFLQTRGVCLNYQVLRTMYHDRKTHRLREWRGWCDWTRSLPYASLITKEPIQ